MVEGGLHAIEPVIIELMLMGVARNSRPFTCEEEQEVQVLCGIMLA